MTETSNRAKHTRTPALPSLTLWGKSCRNPDAFIKSGISPGRANGRTPSPPSLRRMDGVATQSSPPPANHSLQRHINGPHYLQWPYGEVQRVFRPPRHPRADCAGDGGELSPPNATDGVEVGAVMNSSHLLLSFCPPKKSPSVQRERGNEQRGDDCQGLTAIVWTVPGGASEQNAWTFKY